MLLRARVLTTTITLMLAAGQMLSGAVRAQDGRLPSMGSSAESLLSPAQQQGYGEMMLMQLRHMNLTLEDPLLNEWIQSVGHKLVAANNQQDASFHYFLMREREINAFATLGGYVGVNAGLILLAEKEDELAGVLAHETAHVTQAHVLRAVEQAKRDQLPILLAMLGAIAVSQTAGGSSAANGTIAAVMSAQGLIAQRQINYTRGREAEADRVGIRLLSRAGYSADAMASFFERMQGALRANRGGDREETPDYLLTHPVTQVRIAEAKERARTTETRPVFAVTSSGSNPLLPGHMQISSSAQSAAHPNFDFARERIRALSADTAAQAIKEYQSYGGAPALTDAKRYGLAVAQIRAARYADALDTLGKVSPTYAHHTWIELARAEAHGLAGNTALAAAAFESLVTRMPRSQPVALTYAQVLARRNNKTAAARAQTVLRNIAADAGGDPTFQTVYARANEIAGDTVRAGEAHAEAAYLTGNPEAALLQLHTLKARPDLDYYARARIDARIAAMTPVVLELRRQGFKDWDGPQKDN